MRSTYLLFCLILANCPGQAMAAQLKATGTAEFVALGKPGFIKIHGTGKGLAGELSLSGNSVSGEMIFPFADVTTGVGLRDRHMKEEFLETQKYPDAKLQLKDVKLSGNPTINGFNQSKIPFKGIFTCHGVSHPIEGTIDLATRDKKTVGDAQFSVKISDFGFRKPEYLGMKVLDDVQVNAHIEALN